MPGALIPIIPISSARASARHQMSGILADRELRSQCGILRRPDRGIPHLPDRGRLQQVGPRTRFCYGPAPMPGDSGGGPVKTALRLVLAGLVILVIAGCSGAVSVSDGEKKPSPIKTLSVAEPLEGPIPVGRWRCFLDYDLEAMRATNLRSPLYSCQGGLLGGFKHKYEFRPDGTGWSLNWHNSTSTRIPADAFTISGSERIYSQDDEFRWH